MKKKSIFAFLLKQNLNISNMVYSSRTKLVVVSLRARAKWSEQGDCNSSQTVAYKKFVFLLVKGKVKKS